MSKCINCSFYRLGECHLNPPVRLPRRFDASATSSSRKRDEELLWGWPATGPDNWCGQFATPSPIGADEIQDSTTLPTHMNINAVDKYRGEGTSMTIFFTHPSGGPCWSRELGYHTPAPMPVHIHRIIIAGSHSVHGANGRPKRRKVKIRAPRPNKNKRDGT